MKSIISKGSKVSFYFIRVKGWRSNIIICAVGFTVKETITDKSAASVNQVQGIYLFIESRPAGEYEFLGNIKPKGRFLQSYPYFEGARDALVKSVKKDYRLADGLIFHFNDGNNPTADAIKFKQ